MSLFNKVNHPFIKFVFSCLGLYVIWYFIYDLWLEPLQILDTFVINHLARIAESILSTLGYPLLDYSSIDSTIVTVGIDGSHGVWIGTPCNGIPLFALFTGFVIAYPGRLLNKIMYIPLGLLLIHYLNGLRVTALALVAYYRPDLLDFNHNYTFTVVVYTLVFILWYGWAFYFNKMRFNG